MGKANTDLADVAEWSPTVAELVRLAKLGRAVELVDVERGQLYRYWEAISYIRETAEAVTL